MTRTVWKHFVLVLLLLVLYDLAWQINTYLHMRHPDPMPWLGVARALGYRLPWRVIQELPLAAGISLALLDLRRGAIRTAALVMGVVLCVLVVFDIWGGPALNRAEYAAGSDANWPNVKSPFLSLHDTVGVIGRSAAFLEHRVTIHDVQPNWTPPDTTGPAYRSGLYAPIPPEKLIRIEAVNTFTESMAFLRPFITCGLVLGLLAFAARNVTFRTRHVRRMTLVLASWILVLFSVRYLQQPANWMHFEMGAGRASMFWIPLSTLPGVVVAAYGWHAAARVAREGGV